MIMHAYDTDFGGAVDEAATGKPANLAAILRSDRQLGPGERERLAKFIVAKVSPLRGRPKGPKVSGADQREAAVEYLDRTEAGEKAEAVAKEIYTRLAVHRSTFHGWIVEVGDAIEKLDRMGLPGRNIIRSK
jgi:hypothetical protein